jgi:type IV pilus assembly protein PilQ
MKLVQSRRARWLVSVAALLLILQGCAAKAPSREGVLVPINAIQHRAVDDKTELVIEGEQPLLQYTSFQLTEPLRLVVDITDASIDKFTDRITVNQGAVIDISPSQMDNIARLEIGLTQPVETRVYQSGGKVMVEFGKGAEVVKAEPAPEPPAVALPPQPEPAEKPEIPAKEEPPAKAAATVVRSVKTVPSKTGATVLITGNGMIKPNTFMLEGKKLVIDIPGARSAVRPAVIPVRKGGIDKVRVGQHRAPDKKVRVVLDLTKPMEYTATPKNNSVEIVLNIAKAPKAEEKPVVEKVAPAPAPVVEKVAAAPPEAPVPAPVPAPAAPVAREPVPAAQPAAEALIGAGKYSGRRISLDFQDADLVNVMRLFAEVANLNIILAPDVKGKVTVRMVNIPWDQAMDIILKMNGLGYVFEDNILRIASLPALAKEAEDEMRAKDAKKKAEDLFTRVIAINYSTAKTIESTIKKSLSPRGETVVDERTNTLIVKDIARHIDEVVTLIKVLDKPIPQVIIEARIVEATLNFNRTIGVQWGGTGSMSAATGNATGLSFPNSITVTGGPTMGATPSGSGNFFVNIPAPVGAGTGGGAIGISFGSLSKALNLDLVLSALETTGEGKVISSPRVSALDNKEAKIEQGVSIPFSTVSASGTQIQFVDAKLSLTVTPHVTPDNKIFMKINAQKNAPDTSLLGATGQPSIRKNEAQTEILLADGETAVIGGILTIDRGATVDKIPFFGDIPFIGWLFSRKAVREEKRELIIFITPKVVKQEVI